MMIQCYSWILLFSFFQINAIIDFPIGQKYGMISTSTSESSERFSSAEYAAIARQAKSGNRESLYLYGLMLFYGRGITQDKSRALPYFRQAAIKMHPDAEFAVGISYYNGYGTKTNYSEALKWFHKALEHGHTDATWFLSIMYNNGQGIMIDHEYSFQLLNSSSLQNNIWSKFYLGVMYEYGRGVERNSQHALELYREAAAGGIPDAAYYVGLMYAHGRDDGIAIDYVKALEFFRQAALVGHGPAMNMLGKMYLFGKGVHVDYTRSLYWFDKCVNTKDQRVYDEANLAKKEIETFLNTAKELYPDDL